MSKLVNDETMLVDMIVEGEPTVEQLLAYAENVYPHREIPKQVKLRNAKKELIEEITRLINGTKCAVIDQYTHHELNQVNIVIEFFPEDAAKVPFEKIKNAACLISSKQDVTVDLEFAHYHISYSESGNDHETD